jgi:hypothetical protein
MKIVICGSMTLSPEMIEIGKNLEDRGHSVTLPKFVEDYAKSNSIDQMHRSESAKIKLEHDVLKDYFHKIRAGDAILVVNKERKSIENYVGGNSLIEMAFAYVLDKRVYLLNPIPDMSYRDEIEATKPTIINENLDNL